MVGPIKWEKTRIGLGNHFVGYSINIRIFAFGLTELKTQVLTQQALALDAQRTVRLDLVRKYTHRSAWAAQLLEPPCRCTGRSVFE